MDFSFITIKAHNCGDLFDEDGLYSMFLFFDQLNDYIVIL